MEQRALEEKLDEIAEKRVRQLREKRKMSYEMHTPKEALRNLGRCKKNTMWYLEK